MKIKYVERSFIIELNEKIIDEWNARHPELPEFVSASEARLDEVLCIVDAVGDKLEIKDQIIVKAAHLLGGLAWHKHLAVETKEPQYCLPLYFCAEMD